MTNVTRTMKRDLTDTWALPDEVAIEIKKVEGWDGYFTPAEARQFAADIIEAADRSATLKWKEQKNGALKMVTKKSARVD
jgi:hypothetical protein